MKVFLDVGANLGQTCEAVLDPRYGFDRIVAFEPAAVCWPAIEAIADPRAELCRFGLWRETCKHELYDAGTQSASLFDDYESEERTSRIETIDLVRASDWVAEHISTGDVVFMKLNCEGAECDIVEDLLDSGEFAKIYNVMITFDVRKSESQHSRELPLRRRLRREGHENVSFAEDVMRGATHAERIQHWLGLVGAEESLTLDELRAKYSPTLADLSSRSGRLARTERWLRAHVFRWMPDPLKRLARGIWGRFMRGRREGPE